MNTKAKKIVCIILFSIVLQIMLIPFIYTFILSMKDYKPFAGLFGSAFVGMKNIATVLSSPYFSRLLGNTFSISVIGLIAGAVYVFLASMAIGGIGNRWVKSLVAVFFAIPALIPVTFARFFFPTAMLTGEIPGYQLIAGILGGLRLAGLVSFVSIFTKDDVLKQGLKTTLLFVALKMVTFFSPDATVSLASINPAIYEVADTLATYMYRVGLIDTNFSFSAAVGMIRMIMQLILAIPMIFVVRYIMREEKVVRPQNKLFSLFSISAITPLIFLILSIVLCGSIFSVFSVSGYLGDFAPFMANGFITSLSSAILVAFMAYAVALLGRNSGMLGIIGITLLCAMTGNLISEYLLIRQFGLLNTYLAVAAGNLKLVPMISLLFMFATKNNRSVKKDMAVVIAMILMVFAWTWGDFFTDSIVISDRSKHTASLLARQICTQNNSAMVTEGTGAVGAVLSNAIMAITRVIPLTIVFGGSILVALLNKTNTLEIK